MTVKEIKELDYIKGQYADIEVYRNYNSDGMGFHTDRIQSVESYTDYDEVTEFELMDEEDYNTSICANTGLKFSDLVDPEDKILVLKIKENRILKEGEDYFTTEKAYNEAIHKINADYPEGLEPYDYLAEDCLADYKYKEVVNNYTITGLSEYAAQFLVFKEDDDHDWTDTYYFVDVSLEDIRIFLAKK